jgi:hypothetical protein
MIARKLWRNSSTGRFQILSVLMDAAIHPQDPPSDVRFRGKSEHHVVALQCPFMTQSGHEVHKNYCLAK